MRVEFLRWALGASLLAPLAAAAAPSSVAVTLSPQAPGREIPADFCGLSFETTLARPSPDGVRYFRPEHRSLIDVFRLLRVGSLRIGGNTSDRDAVTDRLPSEADLDSLFSFAKVTSTRVIYCLRLHGGDPATDAAIAHYIEDRYAPLLDSFDIGQEPSAYPVGPAHERTPEESRNGVPEKFPYETYRDDWRRFADAIVAAVPNVGFSGPAVHNNPAWTRRFIADFGRGAHVTLITAHLYPGGAAGRIATPKDGRDRMLGRDFINVYDRLYDGFAPQAAAAGLPYRLEEVNSYFNGGASGASDTFAAALWGLDFMYWWAEHGAAGVNFHGGDTVSSSGGLHVSRYAAFVTSGSGYQIRPLGYGIKAFEQGARGRLIPAEISANADGINLSVYAARDAQGVLTVTLINKEHGATGRVAQVTLAGGTGSAKILALTAPKGDVAATSGITLGGAAIGDDASWSGSWIPAPPLGASGDLTISLPPATAFVIKYTAP